MIDDGYRPEADIVTDSSNMVNYSRIAVASSIAMVTGGLAIITCAVGPLMPRFTLGAVSGATGYLGGLGFACVMFGLGSGIGLYLRPFFFAKSAIESSPHYPIYSPAMGFGIAAVGVVLFLMYAIGYLFRG